MSSSGDEDTRENLTSGGLILYDAVSFYELLCQSEDDLDTLQRLYRHKGTWKQSLTAAFEDAYSINYENIFLHAIGILDALPSGPDIESALKDIHDASQYVVSQAGLLQQDLSGRIYHSALGKTLAKNFATYYTRIPSSDLLAWLAIEHWDDKVVDFASGSGTLLNSAYGRKLSLALLQAIDEDNGIDSLNDIHRQFIENDIYALDAMSFASHLSIVNLAMQRPRGTFRSSGVYQVPVAKQSAGTNPIGSLDLLESNTIEVQQRIGGSARGAREQSMAIGTESQQVTIDRDYDVVIMNPPFTRKDRATKILDMSKVNRLVREYNEDLTGQTGLAASFVLLGDNYLKPKGRLALVLPTSVVDRYSWRAIREMLAENYHVEHMLVSWGRNLAAWSEDTRRREILVVARKLAPAEDSDPGKTIVSHVDKDIDFTQAREIAQLLNNTDPANITIRSPNSQVLFSGTEPLGESKSFPSALLNNHTDNWYRYAAYRKPSLVKLLASMEGILSPDEAPYDVSIGDVTSMFKDFADIQLFLKNIKSAGYRVVDSEPSSEADWTVNTSTIDKLSLKETDVQWVFRDPSLEISQPFNYNKGDLLVTEGGNFYHSMRVAATRPEQPATGSVWFPVSFSDLQTVDGEAVSSDEAGKTVAAWLNSTLGLITLLGYRAEIQGGNCKFKTRQLRHASVLNPEKLTRQQIDHMCEAYDEVKNVEWGILRHQLEEALDDPEHPRRQLDEGVCDALTSERPDIAAIEEDFLNELNGLGHVMD